MRQIALKALSASIFIAGLVHVGIAGPATAQPVSSQSAVAPAQTSSTPASGAAVPGGQVLIGQSVTFAQHMANIGLNPDGSGKGAGATQVSTNTTMASPALASGGVTANSTPVSSAPPEIQSLARALKYDPDLIYEYVYDNVQTLPIYGSLKSSLGALIDNSGTAFDQAELMIALLNEAALYNTTISNPQFEFGQIWLTQAQLSNWLGSDGQYYSAQASLTTGGFATAGFTSGMTCAPVGWAWVQVTINGVVYTFDPAGKLSNQTLTDLQNQPTLCSSNGATQPTAKAYNRTTGISLATATGYTQAGLISDAESTSAGFVSTFNSVKGVQRAKVRTDMASYATNLIAWIRAYKPVSSTADIIGGATINRLPIGTQQRWTSLPYADGAPSAATSTMPSSYRTVLRVYLQNSSQVPVAFNSSDIYGHRLTVTTNSSNQPTLALDGVTKAQMAAQTPGTQLELDLQITHPFASPFANVGQTPFFVTAGNPYVISNGWGTVSRAMVERHRRLLLQNQAANPGNPAAEPVIGEALAMLSYTWLAETSQAAAMTGQISGVQINLVHGVGFTGLKNIGGTNVGPYIDLPENGWGLSQLVNHPAPTGSLTAAESAAFFVALPIASAVEHGAIEQTQGGSISATSTIKLLDTASDPAGLNDTIYDINNGAVSGDTSSYWTSTLYPQFQTHWNPTSVGTADLSTINTLVTSGSQRVIAALEGPETVGVWTGDGFLHINSAGTSFGASISGGYSGGITLNNDPASAAVPATAVAGASTDTQSGAGAALGLATGSAAVSAAPNAALVVDPINSVTGAFENDHADITVGSGKFPYSLTFARNYDSSSRYASSVIGAGWSHSFAFSAKADSDPFAGLGQDSPISGAAAITATYVLLDLLNQSNNAHPLDRLVIGAQIERWLMDQLTENVVAVVQPQQVETFVKLPDGTYNQPLGSSATLALTGGAYAYTTEGKTAFAFNSGGKLATIASPAGPVVTFNYNGSQQLTSVTNGMGRTLTLTYTGGSVTGVSDGSGRSVSYTYDASGNLTKFTDPMGFAATYSYDLPGRLTQIFYPSFPTNAFVTNTYDSFDRVASQADANGKLTELYFAGSRTEFDDPLGNATTFYFTPRGKTLANIDAQGNQTTSAYDDLDRLVTETMPEGNGLAVTYDNTALSSVVRQQNILTLTKTPKPNSSLSQIGEVFTYDANCPASVKTIQDFRGAVTTNTYNATTCNLTEIDQPAVGGVIPKTVYTYNARGQVMTKTDPVGKVTKMVYDTTTEELLSVTDDYSAGSGHLNLLTQFAYDGSAYDGAAGNAIGNVTSTTDPNGNVTTTNYDALRRVTQVSAPTSTGAVTKTTYNADSMVTQVQRATGNVSTPWQTSSSTWSVSGKKLTDTDANGYVTTYAYDTLDRLSTVTDPVSRVTTYAYDQLSRQISVTNTTPPTAVQLSAVTYTPNGKKQTFTDARGNLTSYQYDGFDRLLQTQYPCTTTSTNKVCTDHVLGYSDPDNYEAVTNYDANNNPLTMRRRDGTVITLAYDVLNRPTQKTYSAGGTATFYSYDLDGRPLSALYTSTSGPGVTYAYDTAGRVSSETSSTSSQSHPISFQYDANGNRTRETWPDGLYVTYVYDALNRMTKVEENGATSGLGLLASYSYDPLSERTRIDRGNGTWTTYGYDAGSRLTGLNHFVPNDTSHAVNLTFGYTNASQINSQSSNNSGYDWTGFPLAAVNKAFDGLNRDATIIPLTGGYDAKGNVGADGTRTFAYDADNKMVSATVGANSTTATLSYDPLGRIQQDVDTGGTPSTTLFLYEGSRLSAEYDASGNLLRRYVHGPGTDEPIVWYDYTSGSQARIWLHANGQGSIIALSSEAGIVTNTFAYGPYGEPQAWVGSRFLYTGQIALPEVQLYHYKARAYDPIAGRFLQTDPVGYDGGPNLYAYVGGDPLDLVDSTGHSSGLLANGTPQGGGDVVVRGLGAQQEVNAGSVTLVGGPGYSLGQWAKAAAAEIGGCFTDAGCVNSLLPGSGAIFGAPAEADVVVSRLAVGTDFGSLGVVVDDPGIQLSGYVTHGLEQATARGVTEDVIKNTLSAPSVVLQQTASSYLYINDAAAVAINQAGKVITTYPSSMFDARIQGVLRAARGGGV